MFQTMVRKLLGPVVTDSVRGAIGESIAARQSQVEADYASIEKLRGATVAVGLRKLFTSKHFSICQLETCLEAARVIPDGELMRVLRPLHCIDWADIPPDVRGDVCRRVMAMFNSNPILLNR